MARERRVVDDELVSDQAEEHSARVAEEIRERSGEPVPPIDRERPWGDLGELPIEHERKVFVRKLNPAYGWIDVFDNSDPLTAHSLWDMATWSPDQWISDHPDSNRTSPDFAHISAGDLVFVERVEPRVGKKVLDDPEGYGGQRLLVGLLWVVGVQRYRSASIASRPVTEVWHLPLVQFDAPVYVDQVRKTDPRVRDLECFTDPRRRSLIEVTPTDAILLADVCSLPGWVLTELDPAAVAKRLATVKTGERGVDRRYRTSARARHTLRVRIEQAAVGRVQADLIQQGFVVWSRERIPNFGADLEALRRSSRGVERRLVEVKGLSGADWTSARLQRSQFERACQFANAGDPAGWRVAVQTRALDAAPPGFIEKMADWVRDNWPAPNINW